MAKLHFQQSSLNLFLLLDYNSEPYLYGTLPMQCIQSLMRFHLVKMLPQKVDAYVGSEAAHQVLKKILQKEMKLCIRKSYLRAQYKHQPYLSISSKILLLVSKGCQDSNPVEEHRVLPTISAPAFISAPAIGQLPLRFQHPTPYIPVVVMDHPLNHHTRL